MGLSFAYFTVIYAYNKDYYKNKINKRKYTKRRTLKVYKD